MRLSTAAIVGTLLGLVLVLGSCGEEGTTAADGPGTTRNAGGNEGATAVPQPAGNACRRQLHGFIGSMVALRDDLARGLSYEDYLPRVQATRSVYTRIHAGKLTAPCLLASGGLSERAFNLYIDAANMWGDCLATVTCSTRSIESSLQGKWALASRQLAAAEKGLRAVSGG